MISPDTANWIVVAWMFVIGGIFGSFLNVVVYRLPLGISLIDPPSHCPACKKLIRWYDNVPIFGWIILRGRCRHCQTPISARYPIVETVTAAMFGLLAASEYLSRGSNLPVRPVEVLENIFITGWSSAELYGIYLYHLFLLCTLLAAGLMELDGNRPPRRLFIPALVVGFILPVFWPMLHPVVAWPGLPEWLAGAVDGLAGFAAGALLGGAAQWMLRTQKPSGLALSLTCVGLFLGWQAIMVLAIASVVVQLSCQLIRQRLPRLAAPPSFTVVLLALLWILAWARLVSP